MSYRYQLGSIVSFKVCVSFLIFCLVDLSIGFFKASNFILHSFSPWILWSSLQLPWTLSQVLPTSISLSFSRFFILFLPLKHISLSPHCVKITILCMYKSVTFLDLGEVALCRRWPVHSRSPFFSCHPRAKGQLVPGVVSGLHLQILSTGCEYNFLTSGIAP